MIVGLCVCFWGGAGGAYSTTSAQPAAGKRRGFDGGSITKYNERHMFS